MVSTETLCIVNEPLLSNRTTQDRNDSPRALAGSHRIHLPYAGGQNDPGGRAPIHWAAWTSPPSCAHYRKWNLKPQKKTKESPRANWSARQAGRRTLMATPRKHLDDETAPASAPQVNESKLPGGGKEREGESHRPSCAWR